MLSLSFFDVFDCCLGCLGIGRLRSCRESKKVVGYFAFTFDCHSAATPYHSYATGQLTVCLFCVCCLVSFHFFYWESLPASVGLLRLQQIYQELRPGNETFRVQMVKRIANVTMAIEFLHTMEDLGRFSKKRIVLDCPAEMAKEIIVQHVRDVKLGRRTYHYLLSGLVSIQPPCVGRGRGESAFNKQLLPASAAQLC